jgi:hypothetical protein
MTQGDQDAIVGKTVRELRDAREKLAKLQAKAKEFGQSFSNVSFHMQNSPELLRLEGESTDTRFVQGQRYQYGGIEPHIPKKESLSIDTVLQLRDEIRKTILEQERLAKSLQDMGFRGTVS